MGTTVCLQNSIIYEELKEQNFHDLFAVPVHWYNSWSCFTITHLCYVLQFLWNQTLAAQTFMRYGVMHEISENLHLMEIAHFTVIFLVFYLISCITGGYLYSLHIASHSVV